MPTGPRAAAAACCKAPWHRGSIWPARSSRAKWSVAWRRKATRLVLVSSAITRAKATREWSSAAICTASHREPRRVQSVAYMLAGFAMENLLKGQLVARQVASERAGRFRFNSHDLRQLARDADYEVSDDEDRLLERVQQFAV